MVRSVLAEGLGGWVGTHFVRVRAVDDGHFDKGSFRQLDAAPSRDEIAIDHGLPFARVRVVEDAVELFVWDVTKAVKIVDCIVASSRAYDVVVEWLVCLICFVALVGDWIARLHDAGAEETIVSTVVGREMPANGACAGALLGSLVLACRKLSIRISGYQDSPRPIWSPC